MGYEAWIQLPDGARASAPSERSRNVGRFALILGVAALAAILVRFIGIGSRALWLDEAYSAWFSGMSWAGIWAEMPKYETHPPTYYSILKLWRELFGDSAGALRGLSATAGVAAVPVVALAARELGSLAKVRRPLLFAALACLLLALSPRLVTVGQDARPYALLLLAYAGALTFWLRLSRSFRGSERSDGALADWAGLGATTVAVLWLHGLGILYAAALLGALVFTAAHSATRGRRIRLAATVSATAILYLPCLLMMAGRTGDWSSGWLHWDPIAFPGALLDLYGLHRLDESATPIGARVLMAVLLFVGIRSLWRSGERPLAGGLALLLLFPPLAAAIISQLGFPLFLPRTLAGVLAPAYLIAALAIAQLPKPRLALAAGAVALLFAVNLAQTLARPSLEKWDVAAAILEREMKPGDVVWAYPNDVQLPLERALASRPSIVAIPARYPALDAAGYRRSGSPAVVTIDAEMARDWVRKNRPAPGGTIWLVWMGTAISDPDGSVVAELSQGRLPGRKFEWDSLNLQPLRPDERLSAPSKP